MCKGGVNPETVRYLWVAALRPVLTYGVSCSHMLRKAIDSLEKCQTKLLKAALCVKYYCKNTPLLQALNIKKIFETINENQRDTLKSFMRGNSKGLQFYSYMLSRDHYDLSSIAGRTLIQCKRENVSIVKYLYDDSFGRKIKSQKFPAVENGLVDSIKQILVNGFYNPYLLNLLLSPF